ncbi:PIN domain-containing protein [Mesorhizobium sp. M0909]|uniref:PIN domain-containing protein n=1 Tax=Mesorhizobium sp. M0909 TaxID=2957024 RepID=UPI00333BB58A
MPVFDEEVIKDDIVHGRIGAISLDTTAFDRHACNLDAKAFEGLEQFKATNVAFLLSEVIIGEVKAHINKAASDSKQKLINAIRESSKGWRRSIDKQAILNMTGLIQEPAAFASEFYGQFAELKAVQVVPLNGNVDVSALIGRYFSSTPPFGETANKKSEFPDALTVMSLHSWAAVHNTKVLVVSNDRGWQAFADESERLICVKDLSTALDLFSPHVAHEIASQVLLLLQNGQAPAMYEAIEGEMDWYFESSPPEIEGDATHEYEIEKVDAVPQHWSVADPAELKVLNSDNEFITISINVSAQINISVSVRFFAPDYADRDYVDLGVHTVEQEDALVFPVTVKFNRNFNGEPVVDSVEVQSFPYTSRFYTLDPDWDYEE